MINIINQQDGFLLALLDFTEANLNNSEKFKTEMVEMLDTHPEKIVLDLGRIEYMDSSFLGALVAALKHALSIKSDVVLVNLRRDIHDLFTLIRLDKVFKIYKDFDEAVVA